MWRVPAVDEAFTTRMEEICDLYAKPYDAAEPVICFDEKSKQLIAETRPPMPSREGKPLRRDYEYRRCGTRNIFMAVEPKGGHREVMVTERRAAADFAHAVRRLAETTYGAAKRIHIVLDNLNAHFWKSLEQAFGAIETDRLRLRIQFHYTPAHASWLNMAEIELSILGRQCLNRRIPTEALLTETVRQWTARRNDTRAMINWKFTVKDARAVFTDHKSTKLR